MPSASAVQEVTAMSASESASEFISTALEAIGQLHPTLSVPAEDLVALLKERTGEATLSSESLRELNITDLVVAHCALGGHGDAISAVIQTLRQACNFALRRASTEARDEVFQRVLVRLLSPLDGSAARLIQYRGQASLERWLRVIVAREQQAVIRESSAQIETPVVDDLPDLILDLDIAMANHELRNAFKAAFQTSFASLSVHERLLLRQNFRDGITISDLATLHEVHRNTMARELAQVRARLFTAVTNQLSQRLQVSTNEIRQMLTPADLEVSLSRLFRALPENF